MSVFEKIFSDFHTVADEVDPELLAKVLANPEMRALLNSLAKTMNRCAKLVNNGLLIPIIVKTRVRSYRLSDFSKTNEKKILKKIS